MTVNEKIKALRNEMIKENIDVYYIPTSDYHETEYVGDYFKCREFMSGFTGSAGVLIVTMDEAGLWTDGRYYTQAEGELSGSCIRLFKAGMEGVPKTDEYIAAAVPENGRAGFDGRVVNATYGEKLSEKLAEKNAVIVDSLDLVDRIWTDRPAKTCNKVIDWPLEYAGSDRKEKLSIIRDKMTELKADIHILSTLDNICWLLNLRGSDISHFPVMQSFLMMDMERVKLFVQNSVISAELSYILKCDGIDIFDYDSIYAHISEIKEGKSVLVDKSKINMRILSSIPSGCSIINRFNPEVLCQSIKNETELNNIRKAHIKDGIACTKFMYWLKKNIGREAITEISAADYLEELRKEQGCFDLSFDTISAFGANAAMMHYSATPESYAVLKPEGFLLVDSGGHYMEGSTDITRTYALGPVTEKEKKYYTAVLQGNMRLANAKFLYGCSGQNLDILARGPLWDIGADYRCGTGHGVGYCLNVHEAPNGFRWRIVPERNDSHRLEAGQVTTNEPGYYEEGAFGIRTENEMICIRGEKNEYGQFMKFETITYSPIDLEPVIVEMLSETEKNMINNYHEMVYNVLSPYFSGDELDFLRKATEKI